MSKLYFAKYLPVEGEIKEGDNYLHEMGHVMTHGKLSGDPKYLTGSQKVKLFLCSRNNIREGDKVRILGDISREVEIESVDNGDYYFTGSNGHPTLCGVEELFKVIGEISEKAVWVKEGDEFDEDNISLDLLDLKFPDESCFYLGRHPSDMEYAEKMINERPDRYKYQVRILCPTCKTFH